MFVRRPLGVSNPFFFLGNGPFFDPDPDPPAKDPPAKDPPKDPPKPEVKTVPLGAVVFDSQTAFEDALKDRLERAKTSAATEAAEEEARKQGEYKKIVDEQYNPLKTKVEKELEPELEKWRTLAQSEITTLKAALPDELKELMPTGQSLTDQLDWLRKAAKTVKPKAGHSPDDPDPKGTGATAQLEKLKKQMGLNPGYRT